MSSKPYMGNDFKKPQHNKSIKSHNSERVTKGGQRVWSARPLQPAVLVAVVLDCPTVVPHNNDTPQASTHLSHSRMQSVSDIANKFRTSASLPGVRHGNASLHREAAIHCRMAVVAEVVLGGREAIASPNSSRAQDTAPARVVVVVIEVVTVVVGA